MVSQSKYQMYDSETQLVYSCLSMLNIMGFYCWRNNTGALKDVAGRMVKFGKPGSADILGVTKEGRFIAVECKTKKGKLSPLQEIFLEEVRKRGGIAVVVHSVDELLEHFDHMEMGGNDEDFFD